MTDTNIRRIKDADWPGVWALMKPVIRAGETYPYARDMNDNDAREVWLELSQASYIAESDSGDLLGTYYIKPNQPMLGAHVANCGYIVAENARGRGIATRMCEHSQSEAIRLGYRAMQYNLVVKTNVASINLWKKMGFAIVGALAGAFHHPTLGFVDAFVMYKVLVK